MKFNPACQTSEGTYFKDPDTMADYSAATERVQKCELTAEHKFIWPKVVTSSGQLVKIAFRLFNDEERATYKAYRNKSATVKPAPATVVNNDVAHSHVEQPSATVKEHYMPDVAAVSTLDLIKKCNVSYGVWLFDSITYDLLGVRGNRSYTPIPRSIIPVEDKIRLNIPTGGK